MIQRFDKLAVELPVLKHPSPNSAAAVRELLGGNVGEMSTLMPLLRPHRESPQKNLRTSRP